VKHVRAAALRNDHQGRVAAVDQRPWPRSRVGPSGLYRQLAPVLRHHRSPSQTKTPWCRLICGSSMPIARAPRPPRARTQVELRGGTARPRHVSQSSQSRARARRKATVTIVMEYSEGWAVPAQVHLQFGREETSARADRPTITYQPHHGSSSATANDGGWRTGASCRYRFPTAGLCSAATGG